MSLIDNYKQRLKVVETKTTNAKETRIKLEANLEQAIKTRDDVRKKIEDKGLTPETISNVIAEKTTQLQVVLEKLEQALPQSNESRVIF